MAKPYDGQDCGGSFTNVPVAHDGGGAAINSPVAAGTTAALVVPKTAARLNLVAVGDDAATVKIKAGAAAKAGVITIPPNVQVCLDCAGMNSPAYPDIIEVAAGASAPVSFWFDCTTDGGN